MASSGVMVAISMWRHEAELLRLHLLSAGIDAWLVDAGIVGANPLWANAVGWIKVHVAPADEKKARAALASVKPLESRREDACLSCGATMKEDESVCTRCGWSFDAASDITSH